MPIPPADISTFDVRDEKVFYLTGPSQMIEGPLPGEKPVLHVYDLKERKDEKVLEDLGSYALSADGKKVLYKVEKDYFITDATPERARPRRRRRSSICRTCACAWSPPRSGSRCSIRPGGSSATSSTARR